MSGVTNPLTAEVRARLSVTLASEWWHNRALALCDALDAAEAERGRLREVMIAHLVDTGPCDDADDYGDNGGLCNREGCTYCALERALQPGAFAALAATPPTEEPTNADR